MRRAIGIGLLLLCACRRPERQEVVVYTSVDQVYAEPILRAFEARSGVRVKALYDTEETKSTGVLNRLIAESTHPQADVFWSGDPVRPQALVKRGLVIPRPGPATIGARARVYLINTERLPKESWPRAIRDLIDPRFRGKAAIANPLFGTTTMHLSALFTHWGDKEGQVFLDGLTSNEIRIAASNGEVKRLVVAGEVDFGLTDTDDAYEAMREGKPVAIIYPDGEGLGTLFMPTTLTLIRNGPHPEQAVRFVDDLLAGDAEARLVATGAYLPSKVVTTTTTPTRAMVVDHRALAETMERIQPILRAWAGL